MTETTYRYVLVPAAEVRSDEPRMACLRGSTLHVLAHAGHTSELDAEWSVHAELGWLLKQGGMTHAIVRRPVEQAPRYAIRLVADAQPDEPGYWCDGLDAPTYLARRWNETGRNDYALQSLCLDRLCRRVVAGVVDTHDDWHRAHRDIKPSNTPPAPVEPTKPVGPTPRQIVDAWDAVFRCDEMEDMFACPHPSKYTDGRLSTVEVAGHLTSRSDYEAARRTVLADLRRASAEAERNRVVLDHHPLDLLIGEG